MMTSDKPPTEPNGQPIPLTRGERLARDVLYALKIEKRPWADVLANRRAVVMDTFRQFDAADEFEGMLAAQMAAAHSIFLGSSFLSLDLARPDRERAYYLRQAVRLMGLYRQHFSLLRRCRQDRERDNKESGHSALPRKADSPRCTRSEPLPAQSSPSPAPYSTAAHAAAPAQVPGTPECGPIHPPMPLSSIAEPGPLNLSAIHNRRRRMMESTGLQLAQGP